MELKPTVIKVDRETWDRLEEMLSEPPKECPKLKELFNRPSVFIKP